MKKLAASVAAALLVAGLVPRAIAAPPQQHVEGSIVLPAPFYGAAQGADACFAGGHRRITTATGGQPNGVFAYEFAIDKATWNKPFVLEATGGEGTVDLDLFMYIHYPTVEEWQNSPADAGAPLSIDFQTRAEGGESGKVPPQTIKAIVCMYGGPAGHAGANATFDYLAGKGVKLPKS